MTGGPPGPETSPVNVSVALGLAVALCAAGCSAGGGSAPAATPRFPPGQGPLVRVTGSDVVRRAAREGGHGTVLNVWASWCDPCREEFPALLQAARERAADGVRLMLVSADFPDQEPAIRKFLAEQGVTDSIYLKTGGDMEFINTLDSAWTGTLPATFVYDRSGRLVEFWEGKADEARFRNAMSRALK